MARKLLVADLLCGAGGSSTGCARALAELGLEMELVCLNHWPTAIETHQKNHPEARHYVQDIATVRPHKIVPEGYLDLLMASPTCTHHSVARGGKPTSDQQRSDPWHIITWLTELRVKRIIIENVWEFTSWGPVDPRTGKPVRSRKGEYFRQWIATLRGLGFEVEWRKLNAADFGDATTRQRFILMGRSDGQPIQWPVPTHRKREPGRLDLFPTMKPWRPAREIIDWTIRGRSIFDRKRPLAPKTLARILAGAEKFAWPEPFLVILRNHMAGKPVDEPLPTIAAEGNHIGLAEPIVVRSNMHGRKSPGARGAEDPLMTITTDGGIALASPIILSQHNSGAARSAEEPVPTITTGGAGDADRPGCARPMLVEPFVLNRHGDNGGVRAHSVDDPMPTAVDRGAGYVVEPFVATVAHGNSEGDVTADTRRAHSVEEPLGALHAGGGKYGVVEAFILSQGAGGVPRDVGEPVPTIPTGGAHALIASYYGASVKAQTTDEPLPTVTTKDRFGIIVPVTHTQGGNGSRSTEEPVATLTTAKGGEFALVMPVTHDDGSDRARDVETDPVPTITTANRGELAFITAQHGERPGQAPRVHDVGEPAPTIAATGHVDLVEASADHCGRRYDILFRMLEPHELAAAMGFTTEDASYEFAGTKTEQIRQIGNAVSVRKMKACVGALMADAAPKRRAAPAAETRSAAA